jgi:hypothetical protein
MKQFGLCVSIFIALVSAPLVRAESAQPLTDEYITSIKVGCTDALRGILRIQKSEAATRVNRGREYEALLKLIATFNSRVVLNKLDAPVLTKTTAQIQTKFSDFQRDYIDYARKIDATLDINCKEAPVTFYDNLTAAREARAKVAGDIRDIDGLLGEYQKGLDELKTQLATPPVGDAQ